MVERMRGGRDRVDPDRPQPARRARAADRGHVRGRRVDVDDLAAVVRRCRQLRRARRRHVHRRARPPRRAVPVGRVRRAAAADRVGPPPRHGAGPRRRRPHRHHQRRHDPRPRAVRRVPPRGHPRRRARRGDGLREPARRDVRARREHVADRPDHARPGHRPPRAGRAGEDAVLARRPARATRSSSVGPSARSPATCGPRTTDDAVAHLRAETALDELAARNLVAYLDEQVEATGAIPDDRTIVVERFPDELGDWRICVLTPFGARVHAPWGMALRNVLGERLGVDVQVLWSDDGIVLRLPDAVEHFPVEDLVLDPERVEDLVVDALPGSSLFGARFREAAARALLLPKRRPGERTPLWQQRQKAAGLLEVAAGHPSFPIILETTRECLQDVFDLPSLVGVLRDLQARKIRMVTVDTPKASPFAQSLLYSWIATFMYEGDAPLAERRAAALALDRDLLRELLGDRGAARAARRRRARRARAGSPTPHPGDAGAHPHRRRRRRPPPRPRRPQRRRARGTRAARGAPGADRAARHPPGRRRRGRRRDAARSPGRTRPSTATSSAPRSRPGSRRRSPSHAPLRWSTSSPATPAPTDRSPRATSPCAFGLGAERLGDALQTLVDTDRIVRGEFRPDGTEREWCDAGVLRRLRRRSLARLRHEVEPVDPEVLARFLPAWHGMDAPRHGTDALLDALDPAPGGGGARLHARGGRAPGPGRRLPRRPPRRAARQRRAGVGRRRCDRPARRSGGARVPRPRRPPPAAAARTPRGTGPRRARRAADPSGRLVLARPARRGAQRARARGARRARGTWSGPATSPTTVSRHSAPSWAAAVPPGAPTARPRPGGLRRIGPPAGAGRWSLVRTDAADVTPTARAHALATQLLERHGVVTREGARAEGIVGGYAAVYPVLPRAGGVRQGPARLLRGRARRRAVRAPGRGRPPAHHRNPDPDAEPRVLAATDPAQPVRRRARWPERPEVVGRTGRPGAAGATSSRAAPVASSSAAGLTPPSDASRRPAHP